jgi:hypothetical protein
MGVDYFSNKDMNIVLLSSFEGFLRSLPSLWCYKVNKYILGSDYHIDF